MAIRRTPFPDRFAILPSDSYRFGEASTDGRFDVVTRARLPNGVEALAISVGLLAFDFSHDPELGGVTKVHFDGSGEVPEEAMESTARILQIQSARMRIATFVTACVYGTHAHLSHTSIDDALFPGLHEIFDWSFPRPDLFGIPAHSAAELLSRISSRGAYQATIPTSHVSDGFDLASRLLSARHGYRAADPVSLIVMTYQAMVLHNRQHAGASIALQALVAEAALQELVYAYGLVKDQPARLSHDVRATTVSPTQVKSMKLKASIDFLKEAGILENYLAQRLDALRDTRNLLMHEGKDATPQQSGEGLTAIRDLLCKCTDEKNFELNMSWSYRM